MKQGRAPHRKSTSAAGNKDAAQTWRLYARDLEERYADLEAEHLALQGQYSQLRAGYQTALSRLYRALDRQHA